MKKDYTILVPPSKTEQKVLVTVEIPDASLPDTINPVITGTTPLDPVPTTPPTTPGYEQIYELNFDKPEDLDPFGNNQYGNGKIEAGRFHAIPASVSAGIRSEVQFGDAQTPLEGAVEYDVEYVKVFQNNGHSVQWHPSTNGGSASPGLWHIDGKFVLVNWLNGTNVRYPTSIPIQPGKVYRVRIEYKFGAAGYLRMFLDGAKVLDKTGIRVGDGSKPYFKLGINMWDQPATNGEAYYDNLKIYKKIG